VTQCRNAVLRGCQGLLSDCDGRVTTSTVFGVDRPSAVKSSVREPIVLLSLHAVLLRKLPLLIEAERLRARCSVVRCVDGRSLTSLRVRRFSSADSLLARGRIRRKTTVLSSTNSFSFFALDDTGRNFFPRVGVVGWSSSSRSSFPSRPSDPIRVANIVLLLLEIDVTEDGDSEGRDRVEGRKTTNASLPTESSSVWLGTGAPPRFLFIGDRDPARETSEDEDRTRTRVFARLIIFAPPDLPLRIVSSKLRTAFDFAPSFDAWRDASESLSIFKEKSKGVRSVLGVIWRTDEDDADKILDPPDGEESSLAHVALRRKSVFGTGVRHSMRDVGDGVVAGRPAAALSLSLNISNMPMCGDFAPIFRLCDIRVLEGGLSRDELPVEYPSPNKAASAADDPSIAAAGSCMNSM